MKNVKPPETSRVVAPARLNPSSMRCAPRDSCRRSSYTLCSAATSSPSRSATRRVRLSRKSISPRIAAPVMAATCGLMPIMSAISSMHSMVISVESMSIATSPHAVESLIPGDKAEIETGLKAEVANAFAASRIDEPKSLRLGSGERFDCACAGEPRQRLQQRRVDLRRLYHEIDARRHSALPRDRSVVDGSGGHMRRAGRSVSRLAASVL